MRYIALMIFLVGCTTYYPTVITEKISVDENGKETVISRTEKVATPTGIPVVVPTPGVFGYSYPWVPQYYYGPYYYGYGRYNGYLARPYGRGWYGGGGCGPAGYHTGGRVRLGVHGYVR